MDALPAWSVTTAASPRVATDWPPALDREYAWGSGTGAGVRVCLVDSGVDASHPAVGGVAAAVVPRAAADGSVAVEADDAGDVSGHGTACAAIVRQLAPACEIVSVRVLGADLRGSGDLLVEGLRWAVGAGADIVNLSLSTRKRAVADALRDLADQAWFARCLLVASAHNLAVESYPWRFANVVSVGSHDGRDPFELHVNDAPPVDFFARGVDLDVAWLAGERTVVSGNSFAAPHVSGLAARVLSAHPGLTPYEVKTLLRLAAVNVVREAA